MCVCVDTDVNNQLFIICLINSLFFEGLGWGGIGGSGGLIIEISAKLENIID